MELTRKNGELVLQAEAYQLVFAKDRPFVDVIVAGERILELFAYSSVHPISGRDETYRIGEWATLETSNGIDVSVIVRSTAWDTKTYRFRCTPTRFSYSIDVEGTGDLAEVVYFGGYHSAHNPRWGTGFFWSGQRFEQLFAPEPNIPEVYYLPPGSGAKIDLTGVPIPAKGDWFFTPPPFCYAVQISSGWLGMGIEARAGENTYTEYLYHGAHQAFHLSLSYEGHTHVSGRYSLPSIGFDFAADEYAAVGKHIEALRAARYVPIPEGEEKPAWWRTPIYCGWGSECYLAAREGGRAPDYARQEHYDGFMNALDANNLHPGIVVIDDKWQANYGENTVNEDKWPDLTGFIAQQHLLGRHVLLWLKAWDPEGIPVDECVTNAAGDPIAIDPTNPAFEFRLRTAVRRMLSSTGYDADGFKIDFTARIPSGPGLRSHRPLWGIEMMRRYLEILCSESKRVKPDALIMSHTPHPYLADVLDMIRLNDINMGSDVNKAMRHRARIARLACPEAIIDTDNWPIKDKATWRAYMEIQPELGVPSLYFATHIDTTQEPLTADDYTLIRAVWAKSQQF